MGTRSAVTASETRAVLLISSDGASAELRPTRCQVPAGPSEPGAGPRTGCRSGYEAASRPRPGDQVPLLLRRATRRTSGCGEVHLPSAARHPRLPSVRRSPADAPRRRGAARPPPAPSGGRGRPSGAPRGRRAPAPSRRVGPMRAKPARRRPRGRERGTPRRGPRRGGPARMPSRRCGSAPAPARGSRGWTGPHRGSARQWQPPPRMLGARRADHRSQVPQATGSRRYFRSAQSSGPAHGGPSAPGRPAAPARLVASGGAQRGPARTHTGRPTAPPRSRKVPYARSEPASAT